MAAHNNNQNCTLLDFIDDQLPPAHRFAAMGYAQAEVRPPPSLPEIVALEPPTVPDIEKVVPLHTDLPTTSPHVFNEVTTLGERSPAPAQNPSTNSVEWLSYRRLEALPDTIHEELTQHLRNKSVTITYKTHYKLEPHRKHQLETNQLTLLCYYLGMLGRTPEQCEMSARLLAKFAVEDADRVILDLMQFAPGIFTIAHIGWFLRSMMLRVHLLPRATPDDILLKAEEESILCRTGCKLIAAYHEQFVRHKRYRHDNEDTARPTNVAEPLQSVYEKLGRTRNDIEILRHVIFSEAQLRSNSDPLGWFFGILLEGCGQFVDSLKARKDKRIERTAAVLAFLSSTASLIPVAGQFAGIVGLIVDRTLLHFWKSNDLRPVIMRLDGQIQTVVNLQFGTGGMAARQKIDDILHTIVRTQLSGRAVTEHSDFRDRVGRWFRCRLRLPGTK